MFLDNYQKQKHRVIITYFNVNRQLTLEGFFVLKGLTSIFVIALGVIFISDNALGHADHDKARFVSPYGSDIGKCDDPEKPCKTVSYAGLKSNKGDKVLLSEGNYVVNDVDTLFYLLSDLVPVEGSYSLKTNFKRPRTRLS